MDIQKANYPRNCWWVGARSEEVNRKPLGRWLLDQPVVFFRKEDGSVVALEDRCPHRWAPLSGGSVVGDSLVCGYHGLQFSAEGKCVKIPTQCKIPNNAKVKAYPVLERGPFVWIWMGDPDRAGEIDIPELDYITDDGWIRLGDYMHLKSNYFLLQENVLDLTHFTFVHADTLQFEGWDSGEDTVSVDGETVSFSRTTRQIHLSPLLTMPSGIEAGTIADTTTFGSMLLPGAHTAGIDIQDPLRGKNNGRDFNFRIAHFTTPETPSTSHYWWIVGQNYGVEGSAVQEMVQKGFIEAFDQDKVILENIQNIVAKDPRHSDSTEISVIADQAAVQARRILNAMIARDERPKAYDELVREETTVLSN